MMNCCYLWAYNYSNGMASDRNFSFTTLNLPPAQLRMRRDASGRVRVYDRWRSRWVVLTPEEWVRQQFVSMLVTTRGYVSGRIANEVSLDLNGTPRRCDTVVYRYDGKPLMIVEYKAPEVVITQAVFDQIYARGHRQRDGDEQFVEVALPPLGGGERQHGDAQQHERERDNSISCIVFRIEFRAAKIQQMLRNDTERGGVIALRIRLKNVANRNLRQTACPLCSQNPYNFANS